MKYVLAFLFVFSSNAFANDIGKPFVQLGHAASVQSVAFSPDGTQLVSGSLDKTLKLWDIKIRKELATFKGHSDFVSGVAFSPDGTQVVSGSWDKTLKLWDIKTRKELATFKGHSDYVSSVAFSPDGTQLTSGNENTWKLWDVKTGKELLQLFTFNDGEWVAITHDGYFNASKNGAKHLNVLTGPLSVSSIDAYYEKFYRPDIIKLAIAGKHYDTRE